MADLERMTVVFPAPMAKAIRDKVDAGEYATASEVVRDAMRLWMLREEERQREIEYLRQAWQEGIESGPTVPWDMKEMRARWKAEEDRPLRRRG